MRCLAYYSKVEVNHKDSTRNIMIPNLAFFRHFYHIIGKNSLKSCKNFFRFFSKVLSLKTSLSVFKKKLERLKICCKFLSAGQKLDI